MPPMSESRRLAIPGRRHGGARLGQRERGVALLIAILLVALGTLIATSLAYDDAMTTRRTIAEFDYDQALLITEGTEAFAAYGLQQTLRNDSAATYPAQAWGQPLGPIEVAPGVTLEGSLEDLQGRFNLNDLVQAGDVTPNLTAVAAFQQLLKIVGLQPVWAEDMVNWIDRNPSPVYPNGASDTAYLEMDPPYHTPNLPITSASELLALPGFGRARFEKIAAYVTALPVGTPLNVCSASPYVLDAFLGHQEYSADPRQFARDRAAAGGCFPTLKEFQTAYTNTGSSGSPLNTGQLANFLRNFSEQSSWFRLSTYVRSGSTEFAFYSLLYRDSTSGLVRPILRSDTPN